MNNVYYITEKDFQDFIDRLTNDAEVFFPFEKSPGPRKEKDYFYQKISPGACLKFNPYRTIEPLRTFFVSAYDKLAHYFTDKKEVLVDPKKKTIIFGVKSCDLVEQKVQDFVFLEGVDVDTAYKIKRENTILVSGDCTDFKEVCHCLAWEVLPYPQDGFDLNISPLNDGFLVEVGSVKGQGLVDAYKGLFSIAKDTQIAARKAKRDGLIDRLKRHLLPQNLVKYTDVQRLVKEGYNLDTWKQFMQTCVECGGCNFACGTCHCFLLADRKEDKLNSKVRLWDSCLYANFARVAGGANPLKLRAQRLRNRFLKKFDFFVDNMGKPACCGCGRCIEVCPGKIDIREVLKDLEKKLSCKK